MQFLRIVLSFKFTPKKNYKVCLSVSFNNQSSFMSLSINFTCFAGYFSFPLKFISLYIVVEFDIQPTIGIEESI